jgi:hypothetical protein
MLGLNYPVSFFSASEGSQGLLDSVLDSISSWNKEQWTT